MKYSVLITPAAQEELLEVFAYIYRDAPGAAEQWLAKIYKKIDTLEDFPTRCPIAPDSEHIGEELRHLIFKRYRIIFRIEETDRIVRIVGVRHGARLRINESVGEEMEE